MNPEDEAVPGFGIHSLCRVLLFLPNGVCHVMLRGTQLKASQAIIYTLFSIAE